ncbi:Ger(x)C family spore germination protein [Terribacillus sp. DMT04]|uniref:Ger(x)C family spore germination protein n=1 Tax=Terribacillus sp. DMT04 TaxID=2850441 RepID=UPI001C2BE8D1|nr:Ger(x)C family spore germination protein [Terribacillus sp. DMT04]QXE01745.1 Ger(x)C family spore germination protein [Terribacillus sp. DMT04]
MKRNILILLLLLMPLLLGGCFDQKELEEQAFVVSIGVDKTDRSGIYRFSFQIANPEVGSSASGSTTDEPPQEVISVLGTDFLTATNAANATVAKQIALEQARVVIVSEELARSKDFLYLMQSAPSTVDLKLNAQLVVSKENAETFIQENKPQLESRPHKFYQYMLDRAKETGVIPDAPLVRYFLITEGDADLFIAPLATTERDKDPKFGEEDHYKAGEIPIKGKNHTQFMGSAVFKEGQMIDTLTGEETRFCLMFDSTLSQKDIIASYNDPIKPSYQIAGRLEINKVKTKVDYKKDKQSTIDVFVNYSLNVYAIPSTVNYTTNDKNRQILEQSINKQLGQRADRFIRRTQDKYKGEPFYWSLHIRPKFLTIKQYEEADWSKKIYPNAKVRVHFQLRGLEFGKMLRESSITDVRD